MQMQIKSDSGSTLVLTLGSGSRRKARGERKGKVLNVITRLAKAPPPNQKKLSDKYFGDFIKKFRGCRA